MKACSRTAPRRKSAPVSYTHLSTKAEIGDHDENISFERLTEILGEEDATALRDLALKVYTTAADHAAERGVILADTKFEFGRLGDTIILADEVLTPD